MVVQATLEAVMLMGDAEENWRRFSFNRDGFFHDPHGQVISLWGMVEFQRFWNELDSMFSAPLGRKLLYAATDCEEEIVMKSGLYRRKGWFSGRENKRRLHERWRSMGWGLPEGDGILQPCHDQLTVGLFLAHAEWRDAQRLDINWQQISDARLEIEVAPNSRPINDLPQLQPLPWGYHMGHSDCEHPGIEMDLDWRSYGFFVGQERSFFLPVNLLHRLAIEASGRPLQVTKDASLHLNVKLEHPSSSTFAAFSMAAYRGYLNSDAHAFVLEPSDWLDLLQLRLNQRGLGGARLDGVWRSGERSATFIIQSPLPAVAVGLICGLWQRALGGRIEATVEVAENRVILEIQEVNISFEE